MTASWCQVGTFERSCINEVLWSCWCRGYRVVGARWWRHWRTIELRAIIGARVYARRLRRNIYADVGRWIGGYLPPFEHSTFLTTTGTAGAASRSAATAAESLRAPALCARSARFGS